ncbi:MAG: hypothetical protein R6U11_04730, partial [Bacteroidales bacterium]
MKITRKHIIYICFLLLSAGAFSQAIPEHISNRALYDFIDELANDHIIEIKSVAKPYSRSFIAEKLREASESKEKLTSRQQRQLEMYINDFAIELEIVKKSDVTIYKKDSTILWSLFTPTLDYRDSLFRFSLRPIYGIQYYTNENGQIRHTWGGAEVNAYIGNHVSVYVSLRDNQQKGERLAAPLYLTQALGG